MEKINDLKRSVCYFAATTCPDPGTPLHGTRMCTTATHAFGSICSFQCDKNFQLVGNERIICRSEAGATSWSGITPICKGMRLSKSRQEHFRGSLHLSDVWTCRKVTLWSFWRQVWMLVAARTSASAADQAEARRTKQCISSRERGNITPEENRFPRWFPLLILSVFIDASYVCEPDSISDRIIDSHFHSCNHQRFPFLINITWKRHQVQLIKHQSWAVQHKTIWQFSCAPTAGSDTQPIFFSEITPPRIEVCPSNIQVTTSTAITEIQNPKVIFRTGDGKVAPHRCKPFEDRPSYNFTIGLHKVICEAYDPAFNDEQAVTSCEFTIKIKRKSNFSLFNKKETDFKKQSNNGAVILKSTVQKERRKWNKKENSEINFLSSFGNFKTKEQIVFNKTKHFKQNQLAWSCFGLLWGTKWKLHFKGFCVEWIMCLPASNRESISLGAIIWKLVSARKLIQSMVSVTWQTRNEKRRQIISFQLNSCKINDDHNRPRK